MTQTAKLAASNGPADDWFGNSVSVSGDTVVVGAPTNYLGASPGQGSAYLFVKPVGGWTDMTQSAKLFASDGAASDVFGWSVAVSSDCVVTGAPGADLDPLGKQGAAYTFAKPAVGWVDMTQTAKLIASDRTPGDLLGWSVAVSGDTVVVVPTWGHIGPNSQQRLAYVYHECCQECVHPPAGMVAWWAMDESTGPTALDSVNGHHAAYSTSPSPTPTSSGKVGSTFL